MSKQLDKPDIEADGPENVVAKLARSISDPANYSKHKKTVNHLATFKDFLVNFSGSITILVGDGLYVDNSRRLVCDSCGFVQSYLEQCNVRQVAACHKRDYPLCPNLTKANSTQLNGAEVPSSSSAASESESYYLQNSEKSKELQWKIDRNDPDFNQLKDESARYATYNDWPQTAHADPRLLARAGFFYTGIGDRVQCSYCRGILKNWEPHDVPAAEHKRHFPSCEFVGRLRAHGESTTSKTKSSSSAEASSQTKAVDPREIRARMDLPLIQLVTEMGYPRHLIKRAVEEQLNTKGDDFASAEELLSAVLELQNDSELTSRTIENTSRNSQEHEITQNKPTSTLSLPNDEETKTITSVKKNTTNDLLEIQTDPESEEDRLKEEYLKLKERKTCKICMDDDIDTLLLPCDHLVCCSNCAPRINSCPLCRKPIKGTIRIFFS